MILFADSFDHYVTANMAAKWDGGLHGSASIGASFGRNSTAGSTPNQTQRRNIQQNLVTAWMAGAVKVQAYSTASTSNKVLAEWCEGGSVQMSLTLASDGNLRLYRGALNGGIVIAGPTPSGVTWTAAHQHVQWKITIDSSAGTSEVKINGVTVMNLSLIHI